MKSVKDATPTTRRLYDITVNEEGVLNWLSLGHPDAGELSAIFYNLMASCRLRGINPDEYPRGVLSRLPGSKITEIEKFTPAE